MKQITVTVLVDAPLETVWDAWTTPQDIMEWNAASDDWHCPHALNNLRVGGKFSYTMAARNGSVSFDFEGTYTEVTQHERIAFAMTDGRRVRITFEKQHNGVLVTESFEAEDDNSLEMQRAGWQAILSRFALHAAKNS